MTTTRRFETALASGRTARVIRLDLERLDVLPLYLQAASDIETAMAAELGMARQRYKAGEYGLDRSGDYRMVPVSTPEQRLGMPQDINTRFGPMRLFTQRAQAALEQNTYRAAPLHLLRLAAHRLNKDELLVNANHFLFLPPELDQFWNAYGDPIGLVASNGIVHNAAQLPRSCLIEDTSGFTIRRLAFSDHRILLPDGTDIPTHGLGPPEPTVSPQAFALFFGSVGGATTVAKGTCDLAYVGRHPQALKDGGGMPIPTAGCVVRFASRSEAEAAALAGPITYSLPRPLHSGVQTGPLLVSDGRITRHTGCVLTEEAMSPDSSLPDTAVLSPFGWKADWHTTRAARLATGITTENKLFFCAVEGTSSFLAADGNSEGATLDDLAELMRDQGLSEHCISTVVARRRFSAVGEAHW